MEKITKINFGSDFDFECCLPGVADNDFDGWVYSRQMPTSRFRFGRKNGNAEKCEVSDYDVVEVYCDGNTLGRGFLKLVYDIHYPDDRHADGFRTERRSLNLPIEIVNSGAGSCSGGTISVGDTQLMKRLKEIENLAKNVPSKDDVQGMVADAVNAGKTLAFVFDKAGHYQSPTAVLFSRDCNYFYRYNPDNERVPVPAEEGYNELVDGQLCASTSRIFRCGRHYYRHSGTQLIDIFIESSQPSVGSCRVPSLKAHPGVAYRDRGFVRLGKSDAPDKLVWNLANLFWRGDDGLIPFSDLVFSEIEEYERDGDIVSFDGDPAHANIIIALPHYEGCKTDVPEDSRIFVTTDSFGRKIFYSRQCPLNEQPLPRVKASDITVKAKIVSVFDGHGNIKEKEVFSLGHQHGHTLEIRQWCRRRNRLFYKFGDTYCRIWKWRRINGVHAGVKASPSTHKVLIRARRVSKYKKGEWNYFQLNLKTCKIRESRLRINP